ncbi:hypothetical protein [Parabacteroides gordonii]|jgi:hypothetical protein|uniref:hypothetical protein n=1 Tax=Parabacteroides gordonii TaxID=574930 RepID=UPI00241F6521|nr:hypothetical protein [Parabacteroides gordonii]
MNRTIFTLLIVLTTLPLVAWGEEFNINQESVTITTSGTYTISGNLQTETANSIVVESGVEATITLQNVNINSKSCAFDIQGNAAVTLILSGENILKSADNYPGIHCENQTDDVFTDVNSTASLTIQGNGKLTVTGGEECAGIGGDNGWDDTVGGHGGIITIESGTIVAQGGSYGAGIGGGSGGSGGRITIKGGDITAKGGHDSAGIGGGSNYDGKFNGGRIIITGGQITATAGSYAHAIGDGSGNNNTDCLILGPDATITTTGDISDYSNGFSFYNNQTNAAVKGNPVIPAGTTITIDNGETLTVPEGATLTIEEGATLINKGTITTTGNGVITNNGAIHNSGTLPDNIGGKVLPSFQNVTIADITTVTYTGQPVTPEPTVTDQSANGQLTLNTDYTLTYSNNINAGRSAKVIITPNKDKYFGDPIEKTFTITTATLTVTPEAGQFHYQDENDIYPVYTYSGNVNGETPGFTNNLEWGDDGYIKQGSLALADNNTGNFKASNYTLTVVETAFTPIAENIAEKEAMLETEGGSSKVNEWYTENVIIKAPTDFKIKQTGVTELRSTDDWTATSLTFDREGKYTVTYQLKRDRRTSPLTEKSVDINLDKSAPTIGQPVKGADGKSFSLEVGDAYSGIATIAYTLNSAGETTDDGFTKGDKSYTLSLTSLDYGTHSITVTVTDMAGHLTTDTRSIELKEPEQPEQPGKPENPDQPVVDPDPIYYTVTLPAVEGATTDPVAGEYQVESWSSFRFYLTLDSDYSQAEPVVTTDRSETLIPRTSDGAYIVKFVRDDVAIFIDGIVKNPDPVANEELQTEGFRIYAGGGYLHIQTPKPEKVYIFTPDGRLKTMLSVTDSGERIALPKGVYFVKAGERVYKTVL